MSEQTMESTALAERTLRWIEGEEEFRNKDGTKQPQLFHGVTTMGELAREVLSLAHKLMEAERRIEAVLKYTVKEENPTLDPLVAAQNYLRELVRDALRPEEACVFSLGFCSALLPCLRSLRL